MMFTIESILGDKLSKRSTRAESQEHSSGENDDGGPRDAPAAESAKGTLRLRTPQPFAAGPRSSRKRKSLSDGEDDEDNDISGTELKYANAATYVRC